MKKMGLAVVVVATLAGAGWALRSLFPQWMRAAGAAVRPVARASRTAQDAVPTPDDAKGLASTARGAVPTGS